jgi:pimeloyl-ACP methyl ester carboxylesterase
MIIYILLYANDTKCCFNIQEKITQQGEYESLHRDIMAGFGKWEFGPTELRNPFPYNNGSVHIWQGFKDTIIPYTLNRYISQQLPWIHYHEVPDGGHLFIFKKNQCESIIRALIILIRYLI